MKDYITDIEAAEFTGLSVSYLRKLRMDHYKADGPPYLKIGRRCVYQPSKLVEWMNSHETQ